MLDFRKIEFKDENLINSVFNKIKENADYIYKIDDRTIEISENDINNIKELDL